MQYSADQTAPGERVPYKQYRHGTKAWRLQKGLTWWKKDVALKVGDPKEKWWHGGG